ncbi:MAG: FtsW/RodA/SpoVE family cell cycle protein [Flavobacteriaceae bacterium]
MGKVRAKVFRKFTIQSSSDFIYAIIIITVCRSLVLILSYIGLLFRIIIKNNKTEPFSVLYCSGVGIPIIFQALINMAVAAGLFLLRGNHYLSISTGGTSIWMTLFCHRYCVEWLALPEKRI